MVVATAVDGSVEVCSGFGASLFGGKRLREESSWWRDWYKRRGGLLAAGGIIRMRFVEMWRSCGA